MTYSRSSGKQAMNVGRYCRYIAMACRRERETSLLCEDGRIGNRSATLSSLANIAEASRTKADALWRGFRCAVLRYAATNTRIATHSADDGGSSSMSDFDILCVASDIRPTKHGFAVARVNNGKGYLRQTGARQSAIATPNNLCREPQAVSAGRAHLSPTGALMPAFGDVYGFTSANLVPGGI